MAQQENETEGKDQIIIELRGTGYELADAVAKKGRHTHRCQAKLQDQARWHKDECERLHARVIAIEAQLVA